MYTNCLKELIEQGLVDYALVIASEIEKRSESVDIDGINKAIRQVNLADIMNLVVDGIKELRYIYTSVWSPRRLS